MRAIKGALGWMFGTGDDGGDEEEGSSTGHNHQMSETQLRLQAMEKKRQELNGMSHKETYEAKRCGELAAKSRSDSQRSQFKRKGMTHLRRAKMYGTQMIKLEAMMLNYETVTLEAEGMEMTVEIVNGIKQMKVQMDDIAVNLDIGEVESMMENIEELQETHLEVATLLSTPLQGGEVVDELDLENEFDAFMAEEEGRIREEKELEAIRQLESLPPVPKQTSPPPPMDVKGEEKKGEGKIGDNMIPPPRRRPKPRPKRGRGNKRNIQRLEWSMEAGDSGGDRV